MSGIAALDLATGDVVAVRILPSTPAGLQLLDESVVALVNLDDGANQLLYIDTAEATRD